MSPTFSGFGPAASRETLEAALDVANRRALTFRDAFALEAWQRAAPTASSAAMRRLTRAQVERLVAEFAERGISISLLDVEAGRLSAGSVDIAGRYSMSEPIGGAYLVHDLGGPARD